MVVSNIPAMLSYVSKLQREQRVRFNRNGLLTDENDEGRKEGARQMGEFKEVVIMKNHAI